MLRPGRIIYNDYAPLAAKRLVPAYLQVTGIQRDTNSD
jgi:hypothetical protein